MIQVNHANYGTLFAAMIEGSGKLLSTKDEEGLDLPFMSTEKILKELERFGFYVKYDVKSNLPSNMIAFLATVDNLGFDKITRVLLETKTKLDTVVLEPTILVIKSTEDNSDLLTFDCKLRAKRFNEKLAANTIMNVTHEKGMKWDWVTYIANISDILDENVDPVDEYESDTGVEDGSDPVLIPEGYTIHQGDEYDDDEESEDNAE